MEAPRFLEVGELLLEELLEFDLEVAPDLDEDFEEPLLRDELLREPDFEEEDFDDELLFLFAVLGITYLFFR